MNNDNKNNIVQSVEFELDPTSNKYFIYLKCSDGTKLTNKTFSYPTMGGATMAANKFFSFLIGKPVENLPNLNWEYFQ